MIIFIIGFGPAVFLGQTEPEHHHDDEHQHGLEKNTNEWLRIF